MQLINNVLHEHLYHGVLVYNILIYTTTIAEHTWLVWQVLQKLLVENLYMKLSKCKFRQTQLDYLGYRISDGRYWLYGGLGGMALPIWSAGRQ